MCGGWFWRVRTVFFHDSESFDVLESVFVFDVDKSDHRVCGVVWEEVDILVALCTRAKKNVQTDGSLGCVKAVQCWFEQSRQGEGDLLKVREG